MLDGNAIQDANIALKHIQSWKLFIYGQYFWLLMVLQNKCQWMHFVGKGFSSFYHDL